MATKWFKTLRPTSTVAIGCHAANSRDIEAFDDHPHVIEGTLRIRTIVASRPNAPFRAYPELSDQSLGNDSQVRTRVQLAPQNAASRATQRMDNDHIRNRCRWGEAPIVDGHGLADQLGRREVVNGGFPVNLSDVERNVAEFLEHPSRQVLVVAVVSDDAA